MEINLKQLGYDNIKVLGQGIKEWVNHQKIVYIKQWLDSEWDGELKNIDYFISMDARDVIVIGDLMEAFNRFKSFNCQALFNAEYNCWEHDMFKAKQDEINKEHNISKYQYLNSGCYIITKEYLKKFADEYVQYCGVFHPQGDQIVTHKFYVDYYPDVKIDLKNEIFQCLIGHEYIDDPSIESKMSDFSKQSPWIFNEVFVQNEYHVKNGEFKGYTVVDIGANVGMFSYKAIQEGAKEVIAVEANTNTFNQLVNNTKNIPQIKPFNLAVYKESGIKFDSIQKPDFVEFDGRNFIQESNNGSVLSTTIGDIVSRLEGELILKIDVEGAEWDILFNTPKEILQKFKKIFIEIHKFGDYLNNKKYDIDLVDYLKSMDFFIQYHLHIVDGLDMYTFILNKNEVTAMISTRDRYYTTLPSCLTSIALQTIKPEYLLIYDDGEQKDLRNDPLYNHIFNLLSAKGIKWQVIFGTQQGQYVNHQRSINESETLWIWRIDDDNVLEPNVLENLKKNIDNQTGAVASLSIIPNVNGSPIDSSASGKIEEILYTNNVQWYKFSGIREVEHLHNTFLYRKDAVQHFFNLNLSKVGHREETLLSYGIYKNGFKLKVLGDIITWHLRMPYGGIRSETDGMMYQNDENVFLHKMINDYHVVFKNPKHIVLDAGLGDHFVFKKLLPELYERYGKQNIIMSVCYPQVFEDDDITIISGDEMKKRIKNMDDYNIYKWMWEHNWKGELIDAYRRFYL